MAKDEEEDLGQNYNNEEATKNNEEFTIRIYSQAYIATVWPCWAYVIVNQSIRIY